MFNRERPYKDMSDESLKFKLGFTKRMLLTDRSFRKNLSEASRFLPPKELEELAEGLSDFDAGLPVLRKRYKELKRELRRRSWINFSCLQNFVFLRQIPSPPSLILLFVAKCLYWLLITTFISGSPINPRIRMLDTSPGFSDTSQPKVTRNG